MTHSLRVAGSLARGARRIREFLGSARRESGGIGGPWIAHNFPARLPGGDLRTAWLTLENRGSRLWQPQSSYVAVDLDDARLTRLDLPHPVSAGERVTLHWVFRTVALPGTHAFRFTLVEPSPDPSVAECVPPLSVAFEVTEEPITRTRRLRDLVYENHARCWLPADGMSWSSDGTGFPQFAREARGCRVIDVEGREYVDYLMGWGSALLGHANQRIQRAIMDALASGAVPTLTHQWMPEIAETLGQMFPCAEAATFGKNGSDVCTAAVRLARAHTGRPMVLFCGYHGWQDWYVERLGFDSTGVPARPDQLMVPFEFNNLRQVGDLLHAHRGQVAAVLLEPAAPLEGSNGPVREADPDFLRQLAAATRANGALLIFDEILSGFRYERGSVQHATGVVPDLTCLGKALGAGMPLAALVGRRDVFASSIGRICYEPTFKGDSYALAAAREALNIYRELDVPAIVSDIGTRLRAMLRQLFDEYRVPANIVGPPYRMMVTFDEPDSRRRMLMRTLLQQELLKGGVLTTQFLLLPSVAHDDDALETTRRAFERGLTVLAEAMKEDRFAAYLETPPMGG
jgi:glutamate-1-semialdehyde aminotransferase